MWPSDRDNTSPFTPALIYPAIQEPLETPSLDALLFPSSIGSSNPQSLPFDGLPPGETQILTDSFWIATQPVDGVHLKAHCASQDRTQLTIPDDSDPMLRELRWDSFFDGCSTNSQSDLYAARLVFFGSWTDESTPNLLARMFRSQYSQAFTGPWVPNSATSRVIALLKAVEKQLGKQMGTVTLPIFRACVCHSVVEGFHLSINRVRIISL